MRQGIDAVILSLAKMQQAPFVETCGTLGTTKANAQGFVSFETLQTKGVLIANILLYDPKKQSLSSVVSQDLKNFVLHFCSEDFPELVHLSMVAFPTAEGYSLQFYKELSEGKQMIADFTELSEVVIQSGFDIPKFFKALRDYTV